MPFSSSPLTLPSRALNPTGTRQPTERMSTPWQRGARTVASVSQCRQNKEKAWWSTTGSNRWVDMPLSALQEQKCWDTVVRIAHKHLFFLRRLRKFGMTPNIPTILHRCVIKSILTSCMLNPWSQGSARSSEDCRAYHWQQAAYSTGHITCNAGGKACRNCRQQPSYSQTILLPTICQAVLVY